MTVSKTVACMSDDRLLVMVCFVGACQDRRHKVATIYNPARALLVTTMKTTTNVRYQELTASVVATTGTVNNVKHNETGYSMLSNSC